MDNDESVKNTSLFDYFQEEINDEQLQCDVLDDGKSIDCMFESDERNSTINQDTNLNEYGNYGIMLKAFDDAFETIYGDSEVNFIQVQQISEELKTNCLRLISLAKNQKDSIEVETLKSKYTMLENESVTIINDLKCQVTELKQQLKQQTTFSSIIGSTFGFYIWKATQVPVIVDIVLQKDKITNMARLMNSILVSFIQTHNNKTSLIETCEIKFVLNILGIVANLTTTRAGCHFFSQVNDGINVINCIVSLVLCTPSLQNNLKKIAYAALYNVSIQFDGHLLMENNKLIETLNNDIKTIHNNNINDTLIFALKLLHSLTRNNINESMYTIVKKEIHLQEILKLTRQTKTELIARKIYENINFASAKYDLF